MSAESQKQNQAELESAFRTAQNEQDQLLNTPIERLNSRLVDRMSAETYRQRFQTDPEFVALANNGFKNA